MKHTFTLLYLLSFYSVSAQMNSKDSSIQVVAYFDKGEKHSYAINQINYQIKDKDTLDKRSCKYQVDISVKDSTKDSYTIDWYYRDFIIDADNEIYKKIGALAQNLTVTIRTNELGIFQEVVNWKEVHDYIIKVIQPLRNEVKDIPGVNKVMDELEDQFKSKERIEASAINEIQQFYFFHGFKFENGEEIRRKVQLENLMGGKPFDTDLIIWVDESDFKDLDYVVRMTKEVDPEQLTDATYKYLSELARSLKTEMPKRKDFPTLTNKTWTALRIHDSGWPIYGVETKEVASEGIVRVDETTIELQ